MKHALVMLPPLEEEPITIHLQCQACLRLVSGLSQGPGLSQGYNEACEKLAYVDPNIQRSRNLAKVKTLGVGDDITCINGCCDNNTEVCAELALADVTTVQDTCGPCKKNFFN